MKITMTGQVIGQSCTVDQMALIQSIFAALQNVAGLCRTDLDLRVLAAAIADAGLSIGLGRQQEFLDSLGSKRCPVPEFSVN